MSQQEEAGQLQRYCRNCGAEARPGNTFCISCGESLAPALQGSGQANASSSGQQESFGDAGRMVLGAVINNLRTFADPTMLKVALIGLGLLMSLLVFLTPLVRPLLESLGMAPFLVLLLALAASVVLLVLRVGSPRLRGVAKRLGVIAVAIYLFLGLYRLILEYAQTAEIRNAVGVLLLSIVVVGLLLVLADRGSPNAFSERPTSTGNTLRGALLSVVQRIEALPKAFKVLALGSAGLALLLAISHYVFVLGYVLVGASMIALVVQAARRKPSKQAGFACLASIALTLVFGGISHGLYDTGTGLRVSVTPAYGSGTETSGAPAYEVISSEVHEFSPGYRHVLAIVFADSLSKPNLERIAKDISPELQDYDSAVVMVWDKDSVYYDPTFGNKAAGGRNIPAEASASIVFANSPAGASGFKVPEGRYQINPATTPNVRGARS